MSVVGTVLALLVALLAMMAFPRRRQTAGVTVRLALPLFGVATALVLFALGELMLRSLGTAAFAWSLVLPLGLLGWGGGGLAADVPHSWQQRRAVVRAGAAGIAVLTGAAVAIGPLQLLDTLSVDGTMYAGGAIVLLCGVALGASPVLSAKLLGENGDAASSWAWAAHHAGWGLGSAIALVAAHYVPVEQLFNSGVAAYAAAALLLAFALRQR